MHLGIDFFSILIDFGRQVERENRPKIEQKSIQKSLNILVGFLNGFWSIFGQCWDWDPGPSKMGVGAMFQKFTFFMPDSVLD